MKNYTFIAIAAFIAALFCSASTHAQIPLIGSGIVPRNPTSIENIIYFRAERPLCARRDVRYKSIAMENNNITIVFNEATPLTTIPSPFFNSFDWLSDDFDTIDMGRLPPGDYTLTTVGGRCTDGAASLSPDLNKFPFKVTEGRTKNSVATPTIDYSGHWWDENDPGWGLFIWHDESNNMLAAWFTYKADGTPAWYVFQPIWTRQNVTNHAEVWQTSKPPGTRSPPTGATKLATVGKAMLGFYLGVDARITPPIAITQYATLTYSIGDALPQVKTLSKFKAK